MPFSVCYFHLIWTTKNREGLIVPEIESIIVNAVTHKSVELQCPVVAINCVPDHIHVAVSIRPQIAVAEWVRNIKGFSAHEVRAYDPSTNFHWQKGYGVLTFGSRNLQFVMDYIARQKEHHTMNTLEASLERSEE